MYVGLMHKIIPLDRTPVLYEWYMMARFPVRVYKYRQMLIKNPQKKPRLAHTQRAQTPL